MACTPATAGPGCPALRAANAQACADVRTSIRPALLLRVNSPFPSACPAVCTSTPLLLCPCHIRTLRRTALFEPRTRKTRLTAHTSHAIRPARPCPERSLPRRTRPALARSYRPCKALPLCLLPGLSQRRPGTRSQHAQAAQDQYGFTAGCPRCSQLTLLPQPQNACLADSGAPRSSSPGHTRHELTAHAPHAIRPARPCPERSLPCSPPPHTARPARSSRPCKALPLRYLPGPSQERPGLRSQYAQAAHSLHFLALIIPP